VASLRDATRKRTDLVVPTIAREALHYHQNTRLCSMRSAMR
jgi:hypothetical protein